MASTPYSNHLIHEKSPYLLQHAHNPVDWYPWGQEAFDAAKQKDKPIFLSIGYATCHWCHVMEKESFEDPEIAKLMNEAFINIKVDREELPEVDSVYMQLAQALMSAAGGWPLNLILTSDLKPFFAVTYLPPVNKRGLIGMTHFIQHVQNLWSSDERKQLIDQADKVVELFEKMTPSSGEEMPDRSILELAMEAMYEFTDPVYGGFKGEPKFPMSYQSIYLLEYAAVAGDSRALFCAETSLDMMQRGGIYDQLGGGFSRYVIDERWMIPHFEKMLYDNALLARAYLTAWEYTKKDNFRKIADETLQYILRDMTHSQGGFYSAEDADSEGREGTYYTWSLSEIQETLSAEEAEIFCQCYGVTGEGNFEGKNILYLPISLEECAEMRKLDLVQLKDILLKAKSELLKKRSQRPRPFVDDKILTSWNGLMIDAMIKASSSFENSDYEKAAIAAAEFLKANLWKERRLLRRYREGEARFLAGLDDYAFLIKGLISLFEEGMGSQWLSWAMQLTDIVEKELKTPGGAFYYSVENPALLIRKCEFYDGAEPSGNAVHAENLLRLYQISFNESYLKQAEDILKAANIYLQTYPPGACYHLIALNRYLNLKAPTIVIALDEERSLEKEIKEWLRSHFHPHVQVVWKKSDDAVLNAIASLVDKKPIDGQTAVYICTQERCEAPLLLKEDIVKALINMRGKG